MKEKVKTQVMKEKTLLSTVEILPLKDFVIKHNDFYVELKSGESIEIPVKFLQNLKTENVIKE